MIELIIAVMLLASGVACLLYPKKLGVAFCRLGKASWRISTFGLTDMAFFYPEDKVPKVFRMLGVLLILFSILWGVIGVLSESGPGAFAAMRESRDYLKNAYGDSSGGWNLSTNSAPSGAEDFYVEYRYGGHSGTLLATWKGDRYFFVEKAKEK